MSRRPSNIHTAECRHSVRRRLTRFEALERRELLHAGGFHDDELITGHGDNAHWRHEMGPDGLIVDPLPAGVEATPLGQRSSASEESGGGGSVPAVPVYHSLPSATAKLFLDFDGHFEADVWGGENDTTTPVYDVDADPSTFSAAELQFIDNVWKIVAEDFAPFNVDVTTEEPPVLAMGVPIDQANGVAQRIAIGGMAADICGCTAAGVAYVNSFTNAMTNIAFVFAAGRLDGPAYGSVASHEAAHGFGALHQSLYNAAGVKTAEYAPPVGDWAPIMGEHGSLDYATWHNGTSAAGPTAYQDDIAVIGSVQNGFGFRADDHGNTTAAATPLAGGGSNWSGSGIVGSSADVDYFSFTNPVEQSLQLRVDGVELGQNLDAVVELRDATGALVASANPGGSVDAKVVQRLQPGNYFVSAASSGIYGRIGQYTVTVEPAVPGLSIIAPGIPLTTSEAGRSEQFSVVLDAAPTGDVTISLSSTNPAEGAPSVSSLVFTPGNWFTPQSFSVVGVNDSSIDGDAAYSLVIAPAVSADPAYSGLDLADYGLVNLDNDDLGYLYWVDGITDLIQRSSLSGENVQTLVDLKAVFGGDANTHAPRYIALDEAAGKMYWTDSGSDTIRRANLDGSGVQTLLTGLGDPRGIALDAASGKMYWIDTVGDKIRRANLDGSAVQDLVIGGVDGGREIELDLAAGKMYWTDLNNFMIRRANLDGTQVEVLQSGDITFRPSGLELDLAAGKMYFSDYGAAKDINRANLDGTGTEFLVDIGAYEPTAPVHALAIDRAAGRMYWTDIATNVIYRSSLDGSNVAAVAEGLGDAQGIAVLLPTPGITVTPSSGLVTTEAGGTATFSVALNAPATADVVIPLSTSDTTEGSVSPASLTFNATNWDTPQVVTVTGVDDSIHDGNVAYSIVTGAASSADSRYQGMNAIDVAVTNSDDDPPPVQMYFSLESAATLSGVSVANEDIVAFSGSSFSLLFDGSDVGLSSLAIDAFTLVSSNQIVLSFTDAATISGVSGTVDDSDMVLFTATSLGAATAGSFSSYFDASDVGLTTNDEDIDAVERLSDGSILISTVGNFSVTGASGADVDLIRFVPSALGATTSGTWSMYFDASDVGLTTANEDIDAVARDAAGKLYFSTLGGFSVPGRSGEDEDVFTFQPTSLGSNTAGSYGSALFFDGSAWGLSGNDITAIDLPAAVSYTADLWPKSLPPSDGRVVILSASTAETQLGREMLAANDKIDAVKATDLLFHDLGTSAGSEFAVRMRTKALRKAPH